MMRDEDKTKAELIAELRECRKLITQLHESEKRSRDLFESSPDAIFVEDLAGKVLDVNPAACELHGMLWQELVGKHVLDLVPPYLREEVAQSFEKEVIGTNNYIEGYSWTADGRAIPVEIRSTDIEYLGKPALLLHVRDITQRKQNELALRQARDQLEKRVIERTTALAEANQALQQAHDELEERVVQRSSELAEANSALKEMVRQQKQVNEYLAALHETTLGLINRFDLTELLETIIHRVAHPLNTSHVFIALVTPANELKINVGLGLYQNVIGYQFTCGEGMAGTVWKTSHALVVHDYPTWSKRSNADHYRDVQAAMGVPLNHTKAKAKKASIIGVLGVVQLKDSGQTFDNAKIELLHRFAQLASVAIDNVRLFQQVRHERQAAEAANEAKSIFLANVSHELRTPLTSVLGFAKIIKKRMQTRVFPQIKTDDQKTLRTLKQIIDNLQIIISEGERLTSLINNVLDLAKIEAGKVEWQKRPLHISEVIEQAISATSTLFNQKNLQLTVNKAANLPQIIGDRNRLIQVVINLLSNAVKFTASGVITCEVYVNNNQLIVKVIDPGIGIEVTSQTQVFEKFKQLGDTLTNKPHGTGLGLPICKEIVEHHGGKIWVESQLGQGSTFAFSLPIPIQQG